MGVIEDRRRIIATQPHLVTASGAAVSVNIGEPKVERLAVTFAPVQSGSGTPSPSNIRQINGWSSIPVEISAGTDDILAAVPEGLFGSIDLSTGIMTVTHFSKEIVANDFISYYAASGATHSDRICTPKTVLPGTSTGSGNAQGAVIATCMICKENGAATTTLATDAPYAAMSGTNGNTSLFVMFPSSYGITSLNLGKAWIQNHPLTVVFKYATPQTVQLTGLTPRTGTAVIAPFQLGGGTVSPSNVRPIIQILVGESINIGSTYYGGVVDLVSGILTVTHKMVTFGSSSSVSTTFQVGDGVRTWIRDDTMNFYSDIDHNLLSYLSHSSSETPFSTYIPWTWAVDRNYPHYFFWWLPYGDDGVTNATNNGIKAYLGEHPIQVYAALSTPQTVSLTPQSIAALRGQQTVTSPAGSVEISYWTY